MSEIFRPGYYDEFTCIAGRCKHSCCVGWEIDVDEDKIDEYKNVRGDFGKRLRENISEGEAAHFILKEGDRCPFLNEENLCDIIINMGEEALCEICREHPRFYNFFEERIEGGLGLCCEEAARIILSYKDKVKFEEGGCDDEEKVFFNMRNQVFAILQDREWSIEERIENLCEFYNLELPEKKWAEVYKKLERLDEVWDEKLVLLEKEETGVGEEWDLPFEQLIVYFVYRHLAEGLYDGRLEERLKFCILSYKIIRKIFSQGERRMDELCEICRMYSSEVEYSEENVEKLIEMM